MSIVYSFFQGLLFFLVLFLRIVIFASLFLYIGGILVLNSSFFCPFFFSFPHPSRKYTYDGKV